MYLAFYFLGSKATPEKYGSIYITMTLVLVAIVLNLVLRIKIYFDRKQSNDICGQSDNDNETAPINSDMILSYGSILIVSLTAILALNVISLSQHDFNVLALSRVFTVVALGNILPLIKIAGHKPLRKFVRKTLGSLCPPVARMSPSINPGV